MVRILNRASIQSKRLFITQHTRMHGSTIYLKSMFIAIKANKQLFILVSWEIKNCLFFDTCIRKNIFCCEVKNYYNQFCCRLYRYSNQRCWERENERQRQKNSMKVEIISQRIALTAQIEFVLLKFNLFFHFINSWVTIETFNLHFGLL